MTGITPPQKVINAGLGTWYESLTDQDRVKLNRYLDAADDSDSASFLKTVIVAAIDDHNYKFAAKVADTASCVELKGLQKYEFTEAAILAMFNMDRHDDCYRLCDVGLDLLLHDEEVNKAVRARAHGEYPTTINCRNYKINVVVGAWRKFDEADAILDQYVKDGLIDEVECMQRKNSIKTFRLQRTFEGIFSGKMKNSGN